MDKVEQAQYQTMAIHKPTEAKRDYNCRIFAEYHRMDLGKFDSYLLIVIWLTTTV
jgi:hypothetical protein